MAGGLSLIKYNFDVLNNAQYLDSKAPLIVAASGC